MLVRAETEKDLDAIRRINREAFGQNTEADLVDALRRRASPFVSLVCVTSTVDEKARANVEDEVVGHICFSPVTINTEFREFGAMGLAPMSVLPACQRQGIGSLLVRMGLEECKRIGADVVVVLGHAHYYPRFGFIPASSKGLRCEYDVPDDVFMVIELNPVALAGRTGLVKYHPVFAAF